MLYTFKLLQQCKTWNGPATSVEEVYSILQPNPENAGKIVRTEIAYYRNTHKIEVMYRPELFKLNRITHEERLTNLCVLLTFEQSAGAYSILKTVNIISDAEAEEESNILIKVKTYVILWLDDNKKYYRRLKNLCHTHKNHEYVNDLVKD